MYLFDNCGIMKLSKGANLMTQVKFRSILSGDEVITDIEVSTKTETFHR